MPYIIVKDNAEYVTNHTKTSSKELKRANQWKSYDSARNVARIMNASKKNKSIYAVKELTDDGRVIDPFTVTKPSSSPTTFATSKPSLASSASSMVMTDYPMVAEESGEEKDVKEVILNTGEVVFITEKEDAPEKEETSKKKKPVALEEFVNDGENFTDLVKNLIPSLKAIESRHQKLVERLSQLDLAIVDLEHMMEFNEYNARDGYKVYKKMHDIRCERRAIKDELMIISELQNAVNVDAVIQVENNLKSLANRKYTPRTNITAF